MVICECLQNYKLEHKEKQNRMSLSITRKGHLGKNHAVLVEGYDTCIWFFSKHFYYSNFLAFLDMVSPQFWNHTNQNFHSTRTEFTSAFRTRGKESKSLRGLNGVSPNCGDLG